jgi:hypothetical protein
MRYASLFIVFLLGAGLAQAQDLPKRKTGVWEITRTTTRNHDTPQLMQWCIDQSNDNALNQLAEGVANETCKVENMQRDGARLVVNAVCTLGPEQAVSKTHAVITGNFDSAYHLESKSSYDPPMRGGKTEGTAVFDAKWAGACKTGFRPGEVMLPGGTKVKLAPESIAEQKAAAATAKEQADAKAAAKAAGKRSAGGGQSGYQPAPPIPTK